jgi:Holliday junction resolvasome RuvABC DNA-binding subunit
VLRRDRNRCAVDGCRNHRFLDVHHIRPRSEVGNNHDPDYLISICGSHHRLTHAGTLHIDGDARSGFRFVHADGTPYGEAFSPPSIDVAEQAFTALRHMGFKETEVRRLVRDVSQADNPPAQLDDFVREALRIT